MEKLLQRLLLTTLSAESALQDGDLAQMETLLAERSKILIQLQAYAPLVPNATLDQIFDCDRRMSETLEAGMHDRATQIRAERTGPRARKAYENASA